MLVEFGASVLRSFNSRVVVVSEDLLESVSALVVVFLLGATTVCSTTARAAFSKSVLVEIFTEYGKAS